MANNTIRIQMFGSFSLSANGFSIDDSANRSHKVWLLLAYLIYHRDRSVSQEELVKLLWGEENESANPLGALKTTLHRVRSTLDHLFPSAGHELIVRRNGAYAWTDAWETELDITIFEDLYNRSQACSNDEERLELLMSALALYQGDFLTKLSSQIWVVSIATHYYNLYMKGVLEALPLLEQYNRYQEAAALCKHTLQFDPYNETIYQYLMQNLLRLGDQKGAVVAYEEMSDLLLADLGVLPTEESRAIYREAIKTVNDRMISPSMLHQQLQERAPAKGALVCDYDFFKLLYQVEARSLSRSGDVIHIALFSMTDTQGEELAKRSLSHAMDNLLEQIRINLRRGDTVARCSASQYILMLPHANYENSCMVCERIIRAFCRQYPHSPAQLHYSVRPIEPT